MTWTRTLLVVLASTLLTTAHAQCDGCVPDVSCTVDPAFPALCPVVPPDATAGVYYENDFTFWMPSTFTDPGTGFTVDFQQMTITGVSGLPFGLSFTTNAPGDVYYPQESAFGCARVCGTPIGAGNYLITIDIVAAVTFSGIPINAPQQFQVPLTVLPGSGGNNSFSYSPTTGCGSVAATFNALIDAAPAPTTYAWDFGNGSTSSVAQPPVQVYDPPGTYTISLQTTIGGYVLNTVVLTGVNDNWCGDVEEPDVPFVGCTGSPDLYFILTDATGATFTSSTQDNTTTATWDGLALLLDEPPYSIAFFDEDPVSADDALGTYNIPADGEGTYFINVAGGTTGSLVISNEPQQVFTDSDTITVFPLPEMVLAENAGTGELCVANDTLAGYLWLVDGDTVPEATGPCFLPTGPGLWQVVGTNAFGCIATSNAVVVCPVITISRNGNVLFVPSGLLNYQWTYNGTPIGGDEAFVFTQGDGTYAVSATNTNGCVIEAEFVLNTVGMDEVGASGVRIAIYPNPSEGPFTLAAEGLGSGPVRVDVVDLAGRMVMQEQLTATNGTVRSALLLNAAPGSYIVWVRNGVDQHSLRLQLR